MIIKSLLDLDLYKLTMMQAVLHQAPEAYVKYKFKCRNKHIDFSGIFSKLKKEICSLNELRFADDELLYLKGLGFFKQDFINYLKRFRLNSNNVMCSLGVDGNLDIVIDGYWLETILYETLILSIVNELYFNNNIQISDYHYLYKDGNEILNKKINNIHLADAGFRFADFGTRRRFSYEWHDNVIKTFCSNFGHVNNKKFVGTSNVHFAMKYGVKPIGTMAHEWLQAWQQLGPRLIDSQKVALQKWADEYRGSLGVALTDVVNMDSFLSDFDMYFAKLFDGCRHDSGDPIEWCNKLIKHYRSMGIDPKTKTAVFSDGLNVDKARGIYGLFKDQINVSFGIGTNLTNDFGDHFEPLQIVIKMVECNGFPVAKISDSPGKNMCEDDNFIKYLKSVFNIKGENK